MMSTFQLRLAVVICFLVLFFPVLGPPEICCGQESDRELEKDFRVPPSAARPWVYWFWLNSNITREGITADLEAMQKAGIGGVLIMEVDQGTPVGPVAFAGPKWLELFKHVCVEADRLGLEVNMNNDPGWCGSGGPWITPELSMKKVVWSETAAEGPEHQEATLPAPQAEKDYYRDIQVLAFPTPSGNARIGNLPGKTCLAFSGPTSVFPIPADWPETPSAEIVSRDRIVDLTAKMDNTGKLAWDVPMGKWTILRMGYTTTGKPNVPSPVSGAGLECDKMSKEAAEAAFAGLMGKLIAQVGPLTGKSLVATHIDSWECGLQNWTPKFREEFHRRRGYDLFPYLPAITGRIVQSREISERFLWDFRQTINELVLENYAGHFREMAHRNGLRLTNESYGNCPCNELSFSGQSDEPMSEVWSWPKFGASFSSAAMTSGGHVWGKKIIGAEAFTADNNERWLGHPAVIKGLGDWAFCEGINRFVVHRYAMQPWSNVRPGISMGPWGVHYERTQTWWTMSTAWHEYLSRCQYLLRQGLFTADVCYLGGEGMPQSLAGQKRLMAKSSPNPEEPRDRTGYNFDVCPPDALMTRMSVKDGRLMLPDGMSYRLLVLPMMETMTPQLLGKVKELIEAGATVVGSRPAKSPSLSDYPQCDREVKRLAEELWGPGDAPIQLTERKIGKGRLFWSTAFQKKAETAGAAVDQLGSPGIAPSENLDTASTHPQMLPEEDLVNAVMMKLGVPPDFDFQSKSGTRSLRFTHRTLDGADIYFVANRLPQAEEALCAFRIRDKQPEIWRPDTGQMECPAVYDEADGMVRLPIYFEPSGSVFVVFRKAAAPLLERITAVMMEGREVLGTTWRSPSPAADAPKPVNPPDIKLTVDADQGISIQTWQPGKFVLRRADGSTSPIAIDRVSPPMELAGPWEVCFAPGGGAPEEVVFDKLISWSEHPDQGVKYYSGTATYVKTFSLSPEMVNKHRRLGLSLGEVQVMAEVILNEKNLGILWKQPFYVDIADAVKPGENKLEVKVVNLWVNRQIGDEFLPEDSDRNPDGTLKAWPKWVLEGKFSPTGRFTFTSWRLWRKSDPLQPSGLLGPVRIVPSEMIRRRHE